MWCFGNVTLFVFILHTLPKFLNQRPTFKSDQQILKISFITQQTSINFKPNACEPVTDSQLQCLHPATFILSEWFSTAQKLNTKNSSFINFNRNFSHSKDGISFWKGTDGNIVICQIANGGYHYAQKNVENSIEKEKRMSHMRIYKKLIEWHTDEGNVWVED